MDKDTIERNGAVYDYDADFDIYRRRPPAAEPTFREQFGWIFVTLVLTIVCYLSTVL
jgi:hypothetical protein